MLVIVWELRGWTTSGFVILSAGFPGVPSTCSGKTSLTVGCHVLNLQTGTVPSKSIDIGVVSVVSASYHASFGTHGKSGCFLFPLTPFYKQGNLKTTQPLILDPCH